MSSAARDLSAQLEAGWLFSAGCFDAWSAKLAQHVGFTSLHFSGGAFQFSQYAHAALVHTAPEVAAQVARITAAVDVPVLADIETGFGGPEDILRTVRLLESAGAGGVHIEDIPFPAGLWGGPGRDVVERDEAVRRVRAAVAGRTDPDFVIVGRTDSARSFDDVVERCNLFLAAGADVAFPITRSIPVDGRPLSELPPDERLTWHRRLAQEIDGPVLVVGGLGDGHTVDELRGAGIAWVIFPLVSFRAASTAMVHALHEARTTGGAESYTDQYPPALDDAQFWALLGRDQVARNAQEFGPSTRQEQ